MEEFHFTKVNFFFKYRKSFAFPISNLLFILIAQLKKKKKKITGINLHGNPEMYVFTTLNFAFNPQNLVPLKYRKINSKKILLLFGFCANKEDFELPLHYAFRLKIATGRVTSYKIST